jgi:hypothetical protein
MSMGITTVMTVSVGVSVTVPMGVSVTSVSLSVMSVSLVDNLGLESSLRVDNIVDSSDDTIGLEKAVGSLGHSSISVFVGRLVVSGVLIVDSVAVLVFGVSIVVSPAVSCNFGNCDSHKGQENCGGSSVHFDLK